MDRVAVIHDLIRRIDPTIPLIPDYLGSLIQYKQLRLKTTSISCPNGIQNTGKSERPIDRDSIIFIHIDTLHPHITYQPWLDLRWNLQSSNSVSLPGSNASYYHIDGYWYSAIIEPLSRYYNTFLVRDSYTRRLRGNVEQVYTVQPIHRFIAREVILGNMIASDLLDLLQSEFHPLNEDLISPGLVIESDKKLILTSLSDENPSLPYSRWTQGDSETLYNPDTLTLVDILRPTIPYSEMLMKLHLVNILYVEIPILPALLILHIQSEHATVVFQGDLPKLKVLTLMNCEVETLCVAPELLALTLSKCKISNDRLPAYPLELLINNMSLNTTQVPFYPQLCHLLWIDPIQPLPEIPYGIFNLTGENMLPTIEKLADGDMPICDLTPIIATPSLKPYTPQLPELRYLDILEPQLPEPIDVPLLEFLEITYNNPTDRFIGLKLPLYSSLKYLWINQIGNSFNAQIDLGVELPVLEQLILTGVTVIAFPVAPHLQELTLDLVTLINIPIPEYPTVTCRKITDILNFAN